MKLGSTKFITALAKRRKTREPWTQDRPRASMIQLA